MRPWKWCKDNDAIRRVAAVQRTSLVDLYLILQGRQNWKEMLTGDGIHLAPAGQEEIARIIQRGIEPLLTGLITD